jgi:hypothetical protein
MAFPVSPSNGATYTSGGKTYVYNSTKGTWSVSNAGNVAVPTVITTTGGQTISGTLTTTGNATVGGIKTDNYYYANGAAFATGAGSSYPLTSKNALSATSGTGLDFDTLPSWVKKITVMLSGVSTTGSNNLLIQLGTASGVEATGYISTMGVINAGVASQGNSTTGFMVSSQTAARTASGIVTISLIGSNLWVYNSVVKSDTAVIAYGAGNKTLAGTLDRVRVTSTGSTDTFDAGTVNILYE